MRSGILRCYISTLKLRANAPWPSQIKHRQGYRMLALCVVRLPSGFSAPEMALSRAKWGLVRIPVGTPQNPRLQS